MNFFFITMTDTITSKNIDLSPESSFRLLPGHGFGGLEVACWPLVNKFAGSNPAEAVGFLRGGGKSSERLPSEGK